MSAVDAALAPVADGEAERPAEDVDDAEAIGAAIAGALGAWGVADALAVGASPVDATAALVVAVVVAVALAVALAAVCAGSAAELATGTAPLAVSGS